MGQSDWRRRGKGLRRGIEGPPQPGHSQVTCLLRCRLQEPREELLGGDAWLFYCGKVDWLKFFSADVRLVVKCIILMCSLNNRMTWDTCNPSVSSMCALCRDRDWEQCSSPDKTEGTLASRFLFSPLSQMTIGQRVTLPSFEQPSISVLA